MRHKIEPRDLPAEKVARLLHITEQTFVSCLPKLYDRGFPKPDETTGNWDGNAVRRWMDLRSSLTSNGLALAAMPLRNAGEVADERLRKRG
jgi:hypothetical protein